MKEYKALSKKDVFAIPCGEYFERDPSACYLVYAPLANLFFLATQTEVDSIEQSLLRGENTPTIQALLGRDGEKLLSRAEVDYRKAATLYLLLNEKCNFKCRYCYSAGGRDKTVMSREIVESCVDFFLAQRNGSSGKKTIMFVGGGEPTLSWEMVQYATEYALSVAARNSVDVHFRLSSNGSIMTDQMLEFYKLHKFGMQISFEVLPDIQIVQRGDWKSVNDNLTRLLKEGVQCTIRSTVTAENVDRMPEMVAYCLENYKGINSLVCEPVVDPVFFDSQEKIMSYFKHYEKSFMEAQRMARSNGLTLMSSTYGSLRQLRERFCFNLICVTPYGTLTTCPNVSSPNEKGYEEAVFARVDEANKNILFSDSDYSRLTENTIHTVEECRSCMARWNCGSGCPNQRRVYSQEIFNQVCNHTRRMLVNSLVEELAMRHNAKYHTDFYDTIKSKLNN